MSFQVLLLLGTFFSSAVQRLIDFLPEKKVSSYLQVTDGKPSPQLLFGLIHPGFAVYGATEDGIVFS